MRIRAKANGNVLDVPEEQARQLIKAGIYEEVDAEADDSTDDAAKEPERRRYRRRDMNAES